MGMGRSNARGASRMEKKLRRKSRYRTAHAISHSLGIEFSAPLIVHTETSVNQLFVKVESL
jgi:hypothetical protein